MNVFPLAIMCTLCLLPSVSQAQNHFVAELGGGLSDGSNLAAETSSGGSVQATLGFGGRLRGLSPAFYGIARIGAATNSAQGAPRYGLPTATISDTHWAIGARVYIPIIPRLRVLTQAVVGMSVTDVSTRLGKQTMFEGAVAHLALFPSIGLQYRVNGQLSLGFSTEWTIYPADSPNEFVGSTIFARSLDTHGPDSGHATLTVHF